MSTNKGKQEERRKIQIDVTEDARLRLEAILERTPTASRNELFQRALQLLEWAIDEKRAGSRVMVADDRGALKKLEFPFLESVTPQPDLTPELSVETVGATTNIHISLIDPAVYSAIQQHPELLRTLDWRTFEKLLADILERMGYEIELQQGTKDGGIDIIAVKKLDLMGPHRYLLQAKRWSHRVGIEPVRQLLFLHNYERATKSCLATTSLFTKGAWQLANQYKWQLELRDFDGIHAWISKLLREP